MNRQDLEDKIERLANECMDLGFKNRDLESEISGIRSRAKKVAAERDDLRVENARLQGYIDRVKEVERFNAGDECQDNQFFS